MFTGGDAEPEAFLAEPRALPAHYDGHTPAHVEEPSRGRLSFTLNQVAYNDRSRASGTRYGSLARAIHWLH